MPVPTRPTKPSSGTNAFVTNTVIDSTEMNDDFNTLYAGFAALDNANIAASADIDPSKIGDYAVSTTEFKTVSDPGSGGSLTLPTDLEGELKALRYVIERMSIGLDGSTHVKRNDGSSNVDCSWLDYPARPVNLATNGSFDYKSSADVLEPPDGWALHDDPASITLADTDNSEGGGKMVTILTNATTEGIKQTFSALKPSTRYLVSVRARNTGGIKTARLVTTGADAASAFRDITLDTILDTFTSLRAIIQTDSTPTDIVVFLMGVEDAATVHFDHFSLQECSKEVSYPSTGGFSVVSAVTTELALPDGIATASGLSCAAVSPATGYQITARAKINLYSSGGGATKVEVKLTENTVEKDISYWSAPLDHSGVVYVEYTNQNPTPGVTYTYAVTITPTGFAQLMNKSGLGNQRSVLTVNVRQ